MSADLLKEEKPMGISVLPLPAPPQSQGSAQSHMAQAGAVHPQNTVMKETSPLFRHSGENKAFWNAYFGINLSKTQLVSVLAQE